jgi:hypothetical protein
MKDFIKGFGRGIAEVLRTVFETKLFWGLKTGDIIVAALGVSWVLEYLAGKLDWGLIFFALCMYMSVRLQERVMDTRSALITDYAELVDECLESRRRQHEVIVELLQKINDMEAQAQADAISRDDTH